MRRTIVGGTSTVVALCLLAAGQAHAGVSGVFDANNTLLGEYAESFTVIHSPKGYRFQVDGNTGAVSVVATDITGFAFDTGTLMYSTANCTGQAYVTTSPGSPDVGLVFAAGSKGLYAIAKTPTQTTAAMGSSWNGAICSAIAPALYAVVPAQPNDPNTTGVPNVPFVVPLRLEVVPLSQYFRIFQSGFEASYSPGEAWGTWRGVA